MIGQTSTAFDIYTDDETSPSEPIGFVAAVTHTDIVLAIPRSAEGLTALKIGAVVAMGLDDELIGVVTALDTPVPVAEPRADDIILARVMAVGGIAHDGQITPHAPPPSVGARVRLLHADQRLVLRRQSLKAPIPLGTGADDEPFDLDLTALLNGLLTIEGDSGTGKSCSLAVVIRNLLKARFPGRIVLIDTAGAFGRSFGGGAEIVEVTETLVPVTMLTADDIAACLAIDGYPLSEQEHAALQAAVKAEYEDAHRQRRAPRYRMADVISRCHRLAEQASRETTSGYQSVGDRLSAAARDPRLALFFGEDAGRLTAEDVLQTLFRLPDGRPPMAVLQLHHLSADVAPIAASVILRLARDIAEAAGDQIPVLAFLDGFDE
ncbi:MAG: DUF87 domain-containing protein, partial [Pseudomonadota bacterium]